MKIEDLHGIWTLVEMYAESEQGERKLRFGEEPVGRLTYLPEGYMSAFAMRPDRSPLSISMYEGTPEEVWAAFDSFEAYSGMYSVDFEAGVVTHHVDVARLPAYVGSDQTRYFTLEGNTLNIYTTPKTIDGQEWVFHMTWEKLV